jgi:hypothetical protein
MRTHVFQPMAAITAAHAALTVTERSVRNITDVLSAGEYATLLITGEEEAFDLRAITDGVANDENIVQCYAARGSNDDWVHVGQISALQGTLRRQSASTLYYSDLMTISGSNVNILAQAAPNLADTMCLASFRTQGYDRFLFLASTLASTTLRLQTAYVEGIDVSGSTNNLSVNSDTGAGFQITIANTAAGSPASQPCKSCIMWTDADLVYLTIGGGTAAATHFKLPANQMVPIPVKDLDQISLYNNSGGEITMWGIWRN